MTNEEKIAKLMKLTGYKECTCRAWVEFEGKCAYCGEDLISTAFRYFSSPTDHILPKAHYPDFEWDVHNSVPSCTLCNSVKNNLDFLMEGENAEEMHIKKKELINRAKAKLEPKIKDRLRFWKGVRDIILDC